MRRNDRDCYVEKIAYQFITKYSSQNNELPYGVIFNKYMTLVHRDVRDFLGEDIGLPHCWYRWGDEVVRYDMPYVSWIHENSGETRVSYVGSLDHIQRNDRILSYTGSRADEFIRTYRGREGMESAIDQVYSNAPFEFQNNFRILRENLKIAKYRNLLSNHASLVRGLFEEAMDSFPRDEFPGMDIEIEEFESVFNRALDRNLSAEKLQDISESFWFMFCYHLRLHPRCHENVSRRTLEIWNKALLDSKEDYSMAMERYASYLVDDVEADRTIMDLDSRCRKRFGEIEALLREMHTEGE